MFQRLGSKISFRTKIKCFDSEGRMEMLESVAVDVRNNQSD